VSTVPLPGTAIFIVVALAYAWLSDGLFRGRRWPFIYLGAVITIIFAAVIRDRDLYSNIKGTIVLYWFAGVGVSLPAHRLLANGDLTSRKAQGR